MVKRLTQTVHQKWTPTEVRVSFFGAPVTNKRPSATVSLSDVFERLTVDKYYKRCTHALRMISDHQEQQRYKSENFDYVTFSGIFSYGNDQSLTAHSQLLCIDIDHLPNAAEVARVRRLLFDDPYFETLLMFTSPSGLGVKWIIHIDTDLRDHRTWFKLLEAYLLQTYQLKVDPRCINVSRACYLCYDPEAYIHPALLNTSEDGSKTLNISEITAIAEALIAQGKDITAGYDNWLHLGFAFADGMGAEGGALFHRLSQMNDGYNEADCERQWQNCLKAQGEGVTIRTFYKMAQNAGVDLSAIARQFPSKPSIPHGEGDTGKKGLTAFLGDFRPLPHTEGNEGSEEIGCSDQETTTREFSETFSDKINMESLPALLRKIAEDQTDAVSCDKMLLGALTCFSGAIPNVFGVYDKRRVYTPVYVIVSAPAASDKGNLSACRALLQPIENEIRRQNEQEKEMSNTPEEVPHRSLFIPANSSATATYEALANNGEWGVTLETEADTITDALKSDYGNYSTGLRAAFHHEPITYSRRKEKEHVNIFHPRWAVLLTCTPNQIPLLLPSCENGLASRFMFYNMPRKLEWRNVFEGGERVLDDELLVLGERFQTLFHELLARRKNPIQVVLSQAQQKQFNTYFEALQLEQVQLYGDDLIAFVRRLGLVAFRFMMILTVLHLADEGQQPDPLSQSLVCGDEDFQTALTIVDCLINHTTHVYTNLLPHPTDGDQRLADKKLSANEMALFQALSHEFTTSDYLKKAKDLMIPPKTAERYIGKFVSKYHIATRPRQGHYQKCD
jgi:hypothetical protein